MKSIFLTFEIKNIPICIIHHCLVFSRPILQYVGVTENSQILFLERQRFQIKTDTVFRGSASC